MIKRRHRSARDRVKLFERRGGICHLCGGKIMPGESWEWSHPIALELGGDDNDENADLAHTKCHRAHTSNHDAPLIAKVHRLQAKHIGAKPKRPWSQWRRKMNGETVRKA